MASDRQATGELRERFYQSVAETLTLLHTAPGYDRRLALGEVARILASTMDLPLVWIGRREPDLYELEIMVAAGAAAEYANSLKISASESAPGGHGPSAIVLREGRARAVSAEAPEFAPWRDAARRYGLGSCIVAAGSTRDGGQLTLAAYSREHDAFLGEGFLDWAQRLADELARFWDHQALLERNLRMSRYRDAQRTIQRALLEQPDPAAVYLTLAQSLADIAGAAAVDVYAVEDDDPLLHRVALVGPLAQAMRLLPVPPRHSDGSVVFTPTLAFMQGMPVVRTHPARDPGAASAWQLDPLARMGAVGCWPLFMSPDPGPAAERTPSGVFAVVTVEADAFDAEMCRLLDEIADAAGLALRQHEQRRALLQKQELQTYLALHDALTGAPNRRALDLHLAGVLARAERHGRIVAVGLLDLDDLKPINDRHGHAAGDRILVEVAERLRLAMRNEDYVARLGGDEFVLVFEDLEREQDLDSLLARVWQALQQPLVVDGVTFRLSASLGIALYPMHATASGEQLLRRADQAMYQVKARKRQRDRWWALPPAPAGANAAPDAQGDAGQAAYGELARELLEPWFSALQPQLPRLAEDYYAELLAHDGAAPLLGALPEADAESLRQRLVRHLSTLLRPDLEIADHQAEAMQAGFFYAACGVEEVWLLEATESLRDLIATTLGSGTHRDHRPLAIVLQRLALDRQWQLVSMRELQRQRVAVLAQLTALAWSADGYMELIQGVVEVLAAHREIAACAVGRPDRSGQLTYEAVAGEAFADYLRALARGEAAPIAVNGSPEGGGPSGRAWRTASIQRCVHYGSDAAMAGWRQIAARVGIVSSVAVPLCPLPRSPAAILTLYSAYVGGFQSEDQQAFVEQVKTVLDLVLARLAPPRPGTELLPFFVRERWRAMIATDAMQMHYQPVIRLADNRVTELEALARLRETDGTIVLPGRFLPALTDDDLLLLFRQGLLQATTCRQALCEAGYPLDVAVNAPALALADPRYAQTAQDALASSACPPDALLFEILESAVGSEHSIPGGMMGMQAMKALGVRLVEDDLGAGYSSLIRLRQWPFDRVKIDQAIVSRIADDPLRTLRFIRQLIRLGHDLELEVVVEGLETTGAVEAALILGADLGQGYALAHPMPAHALSGWLARFDSRWDAARPQTALGALAGALLWEEQLLALPPDPVFWERHARASCPAGGYLHGGEGGCAALDSSHRAMHEAATGGPATAAFRHARETFLDLLIEHARKQELHPGPRDQAGCAP